MNTNATLVKMPTMPAPKNQYQPPFSLSMRKVTRAMPAVESVAVT